MLQQAVRRLRGEVQTKEQEKRAGQEKEKDKKEPTYSQEGALETETSKRVQRAM